jgi:hypothetical protein
VNVLERGEMAAEVLESSYWKSVTIPDAFRRGMISRQLSPLLGEYVSLEGVED